METSTGLNEHRVIDGKELHAAVVNENQARAAAGLTMALGAIAFVYANFDKLFWPIRAAIYGLLVHRGWRTKDEAYEICPDGACDLDAT